MSNYYKLFNWVGHIFHSFILQMVKIKDEVGLVLRQVCLEINQLCPNLIIKLCKNEEMYVLKNLKQLTCYLQSAMQIDDKQTMKGLEKYRQSALFLYI